MTLIRNFQSISRITKMYARIKRPRKIPLIILQSWNPLAVIVAHTAVAKNTKESPNKEFTALGSLRFVLVYNITCVRIRSASAITITNNRQWEAACLGTRGSSCVEDAFAAGKFGLS